MPERVRLGGIGFGGGGICDEMSLSVLGEMD